MAKQIQPPDHLNPYRYATPRRGDVFPVPAAAIMRDGYALMDDSTPARMMSDRTGVECCCGAVPCDNCCTSDFIASLRNCCYSYTDEGSNENQPDVKVEGFVLQDRITLRRKSDNSLYRDQQMTVIQTAEADWFSDLGIGCSGGRCVSRFDVQFQFRDFVNPSNNYNQNDDITICLGPKKLCGWTEKRLWESNSATLGELLGDADGTCQTFGGWGWPRAFYASDQSTQCTFVSEAWSATDAGGHPSLKGTRDFQMAFGIVLEVLPCNSECEACA